MQNVCILVLLCPDAILEYGIHIIVEKVTCMNNGFTGLPPELVSELLASAVGIADELAGPLRSLSADRENLRARLTERSLLMPKTGSDTQAASDRTVCGIDLFSGTAPSVGSALTCAAAFAVEGLPAPAQQAQWDNPRHKVVLRAEKTSTGSGQLLHAVACEIACELAASVPHDIVLYNRSAIYLFQAIMESLVPAMGAKQSPSGMEFLKRLKTALAAFGKMFLTGGGGSMHAGIVSSSPKQEISRELGLTIPIDDTMIMTALLEPGEATSPVTIDSDELKKTAALPIRDESFSAIRDRIVKAIETCSVVYYRPHKWTPAFRIELPGNAAADTAGIASLLDAVSRQCSSPGSRLPYPLKQVDDLIRRISYAMQTISDSAATSALKSLSDDQGADALASLFYLTMKSGN